MIGVAGRNLSTSVANNRTTLRRPAPRRGGTRRDREDPVELDELKVTRYETTDAVATITLDRPDRLNAWTGRMNTEYRSLLARASADSAVRVIVVTGAGRGFCAGADTRALEGHVERGGYDPGTGPGLETPGYGVRPEFDAELAYHFGIPKPIIAAVNGAAAGVGFALACYCDLRFAAAGAKLTTAHGRLGLPAEFGLSWLLPRLVGLTRAADVLLSSRVLLAEEAAEIGLVNTVTPADELLGTVYEYARTMATEVSPASLAATKLQLYTDLHRDAATAGRDAEVRLRAMMAGPDFAEGVAALAARRPPRFADLPHRPDPATNPDADPAG
jgi:enoyl-CoA hydratase/carnithine racemase